MVKDSAFSRYCVCLGRLLLSPCISYLQIMTIMIDDGGWIVVKGYVLELCING